jgi:chromosome segregation ATPase
MPKIDGNATPPTSQHSQGPFSTERSPKLLQKPAPSPRDKLESLTQENRALKDQVEKLEVTLDTLYERQSRLKAQYNERIRELETQVQQLDDEGGPPTKTRVMEYEGRFGDAHRTAQLEVQLLEAATRVQRLDEEVLMLRGENRQLRIALESLTYPVSSPEDQSAEIRSEDGHGGHSRV